MLIRILKKSKTPANEIRKNLKAYLNCWKRAQNLNQDQLETLIVAMAKLSPSFHFAEPPDSVHCKIVALKYISFLGKRDMTDCDYASEMSPEIEKILAFVKVCMDNIF